MIENILIYLKHNLFLYQSLIGSIIGASIAILYSLWFYKKNKKDNSIQCAESNIFSCQSGLNSIQTYEENLKKQIVILEVQKTNKEDNKYEFVYKFAPTIIDNYQVLTFSTDNNIESGFINFLLGRCKITSEDIKYNAANLSRQIENLFILNEKLIEKGFLNSDYKKIIDPKEIKNTFDNGIDGIIKIINIDMLLTLEEHKKDLITLIGSLVEYINYKKKNNFKKEWDKKINPKYKDLKENIFYKTNVNEEGEYEIRYQYFYSIGKGLIKNIKLSKEDKEK